MNPTLAPPVGVRGNSSSESALFLGIEIGGTKLQLGIGTGDGKLLRFGVENDLEQFVLKKPVEKRLGAAGIRQQIQDGIPELLAKVGVSKAAIRALGIGFGGPFDDATGRSIKSHQIDGWDNFPLAEWADNLLGVPSAIGNDADVAGLGEVQFGAGMNLSPIFYITVGTGIGGGFILDGNIYRAVGRGAAEIGHLKVLDRSMAGTPVMIALEKVAAGPAIGLRAREWAERGEAAGSKLLDFIEGDLAKITGELVGRAAKRHDAFALRVLKESTDALAEAICQMVTLLCPKRIIVGGGVASLGEELFFAPIRKKVAEDVFPPFAGLFDIVPAALGEAVVVHGAVALASQPHER